MNTNVYISLLQAAVVLGISMAETARLVRQGKLAVHHVANRVKFFDAGQVLAYVRSAQAL